MLNRSLTEDERRALVARRDELAPMMAPMHASDKISVQLSIADMFTAFRSMRQTGAEALAVVEASVRALANFPAWAIQTACLDIQQNGVWRNGAFDRQWPPNDAEIVAVVRDKLRLYSDSYQSAVALLAAAHIDQ